jgi:predicted permease
MYKLPLRLSSLFRKEKTDEDLDGELQFHLQAQTEDFIARGIDPEEARYAALRELGGLQQVKEECKEMRKVNWAEHVLQDLRFAFRSYLKNPGFASVVVGTIALGIGVNAAIFSLVNGILLQPFPYPNPDSLVNASYTGPLPEGGFVGFQQRLKNMEVAAYTNSSGFNLSGEGNAVRINGTDVSSNLFSLLGINAHMGRVFRQGDELPGQDHVAIVSYGLWQTRLGGDAKVIGRWITVDDIPRQIVGVMPIDFAFPGAYTQLWIPARVDAQNMWTDFGFWMIGRIKPEVSFETARAEFKAVASNVVKSFPWQMGKDYIPMFDIGPLQRDTVGGVRPTLFLLFAAVAVILLVACVNVANLLLAKASTREREIAIRAALGASRGRIIRQLLTESTLLALAGGAAGVALAFLALSLLKSVLPAYTPRLADVKIDKYVMAFSLVLSLLTGLIFGLAPALHASQADVEQSLKANGLAAGIGRKRKRISSMLVAIEVALAVVLVTGAGQLIQSLHDLTQSQTGMQTDHVITAQISPAASFCRANNACTDFYSQLLQQVRSLPGVKIAAISDSIPLYSVGRSVLAVEGKPDCSPQSPCAIWEFTVSPDYLAAVGIPLLRGRNFDETDRSNSAKVVLIEKSLADLFWPGQDPIGKRIKPSWMPEWRTVIGVVQNVRTYNILPDDYAAKIMGGVYFPVSQGLAGVPTDMNLVVRVQNDPMVLARKLPSLVAQINPTVPVSRIRTMEQIIHLSVAEPRSTTWLFCAFAVLALTLGLVGIYSVVSHGVTQRTREIGVRMAMGAGKWQVLKMVVLQEAKLIGLGLLLGIAIAVSLTRVLASMLHGVRSADPLTFVAAVLLISAAALIATYIPSRRATQVDPTVALKYE